jgi:hypothetical protein
MASMKKSTWLGILVLLALVVAVASLVARKPAAEANSPVAPSAAAERPAAVARIGSSPVPAAEEEVAENPRTRPLPRPKDRKLKPAPPIRQEVPMAAALEGKPGFVVSPYNNKIIDVNGIPPGTLVADPTYPTEEKKYFRVP